MGYGGRQAIANDEGRRKALERFGYADRPADLADESVGQEWALLAPGVAPWLSDVALADLSAAGRELAVERVRQRRALDELMRACDLAHSRIAAGGATPELVEAYAAARDRFEDAVEAFTASAEALAMRLRSEA